MKSGWSLVFLFAASIASGFAAELPGAGPQKKFRFGVTSRMFSGISENDGRAAIKFYIESVGKERGVDFEFPATFTQVQALGEAFRSGELDGASVTLDEYLQISDQVAEVHVFDEPGRALPGEVYVVLVRPDGVTANLADLKGSVLMEYDNMRTSLARMWLDVTLMEQGLPRGEKFFGSVIPEKKLSTAVLPVFFGKAQAGLVTLRGFQTMVELNPQVGKRLRVIATSPPLVPTVTCFGKRADPIATATIVQGIQRLHEQPRGQQLLTIFQGGTRLVEYSTSVLEQAKKLRARHTELVEMQSRGQAGRNGAPPTEAGK